MQRIVVMLVVTVCLSTGRAAEAQEPPPRIERFVVDLHGIVPRFGDDPALAASRGLSQLELPGTGLGLGLGAHVYLPRTGSVTVGVGGDFVIGRSPMPILSGKPDPASPLPPPATETFSSFGPELSLNFGHGNGWSYLSGGIGSTTWWIVPEGAQPLAIDDARTWTINYGGGARWFIKKHLAFSFDVRLYQINPSAAKSESPASPRTRLLIIGAGISVR